MGQNLFTFFEFDQQAVIDKNIKAQKLFKGICLHSISMSFLMTVGMFCSCSYRIRLF